MPRGNAQSASPSCSRGSGQSLACKSYTSGGHSLEKRKGYPLTAGALVYTTSALLSVYSLLSGLIAAMRCYSTVGQGSVSPRQTSLAKTARIGLRAVALSHLLRLQHGAQHLLALCTERRACSVPAPYLKPTDSSLGYNYQTYLSGLKSYLQASRPCPQETDRMSHSTAHTPSRLLRRSFYSWGCSGYYIGILNYSKSCIVGASIGSSSFLPYCRRALTIPVISGVS